MAVYVNNARSYFPPPLQKKKKKNKPRRRHRSSSSRGFLGLLLHLVAAKKKKEEEEENARVCFVCHCYRSHLRWCHCCVLPSMLHFRGKEQRQSHCYLQFEFCVTPTGGYRGGHKRHFLFYVFGGWFFFWVVVVGVCWLLLLLVFVLAIVILPLPLIMACCVQIQSNLQIHAILTTPYNVWSN